MEKLFKSSGNAQQHPRGDGLSAKLTPNRIHTVFYFYIPVIIGLLIYSILKFDIHWTVYLYSLLGCVLFWSAFEYVLHRYLLHARFKNEKLNKMLYDFHGIHHDYPNDNRFILVGMHISIPAGIALFFVARIIFGETNVFPVFSMLLIVYCIYEWMHFAAHNYNFENKWFQKLKHHHLKHHFKDNKRGFGFITTKWDELSKTDFNN